MIARGLGVIFGWESPKYPSWMWYWPFRWWFAYVWPGKCGSCGRRWRDHERECYFA